MRLNQLVLQGYKSFATKTEFLFPTGITAIVGPNGSGKSNIADAIRWALGEQSMRVLRGKSSADMIFAGGQRRARAGMAEVSLTLDNSDGWLPIEFSEVTISRRAYRSGENEYLLNGSRVRLRDVKSLLAESGLGQQTYTVIGQGLVDAALSLRPEERRELFEEAAGIGLYRARREDAVQRLEDTQRNLERVQDIISEITPRLRRLEQEVERAEEYRRLTAHLERLQRTWYGYHWGRQQAALDHTLEVAAALEAKLEAQQDKTSALDERLAQLRSRESKLRSTLRDWHRESADLHDRTNEVQRELAVAEERTRLLKVRREELSAELEPMEAQREAQAERVAQARGRVEELERELTERKKQLAGREREWVIVKEQAQEPARQRVQVERELRARRARLKHLNEELLAAQTEAARLANEQAVAEERARQLKARHEKVLAELKPLDSQRKSQLELVAQARDLVERLERERAERNEQLEELTREWEVLQQRARQPDLERARLEQELRTHRARWEQLKHTLSEVRDRMARLAGEQDALNRLRAAGEACDVGVRTLLQAKLDGVLGPLAALMRVPTRWERAIEAALGPDLQAVVVERTEVIEEVRRLLESVEGWLTLLPLDGLRSPPSLPSGAVGAADVVTCDENVRPAVEAILGAVALCDELEAARALLPAMPPGGRCVTTAGVVLRADGALSIGRVKIGGVLADERARRELPAQLEETRRRCRELEQQEQAERERIAALEAELEGVARQAAEAREEAARVEREKLSQARTAVAVAGEALRSQQAALQREEAAFDRLQAQIAALRQQADELKAEFASIVGRIPELHAEAAGVETPSSELQGHCPAEGESSPPTLATLVGQIQQRCQQIEEQQQIESERVAALESRLEELTRRAETAGEEAARIERETVGQARTEVAVVEEALRSQQSTLQREEALLDQLQAQISARRQRVEELEAEHAAIVARTEELRPEAEQLEEQLRHVRARIQPAEEELQRLREEQLALEEQEQRARNRMHEVETRYGRAQLEVDRRRDELNLLVQRIEEDLGLVELELAESVTAQTPLPLRPLVSQLPVVEELPEGLEEEIQRLKARLRRLGSVNPNAHDDYVEVRERHQFLTEQSSDLQKASAKLRRAVAELDELMEQAFQEIFDAVADQFSKTFTDLFNGGSARLELTDPDDLLNTGVDIVARPPGKRAQRLALLSGGERALTAAALLFAILRVSPAPFCVLDEVDAMLDETNVGRFRALLEELSQRTQFVVITHNRGTIEAADTIYGVSMGADAVSQVVSLKMDESSLEHVSRQKEKEPA